MPTSCASSKTLGGCDKCGGKKQINEDKTNNVKKGDKKKYHQIKK